MRTWQINSLSLVALGGTLYGGIAEKPYIFAMGLVLFIVVALLGLGETVSSIHDDVHDLNERVTQPLAEVWDQAYSLGVSDEETSQDWTDGQVPPARVNPFTKEPWTR